MVMLDQLVPPNHLVRKMEAAIDFTNDFTFIYALVKDMYSEVDAQVFQKGIGIFKIPIPFCLQTGPFIYLNGLFLFLFLCPFLWD